MIYKMANATSVLMIAVYMIIRMGNVFNVRIRTVQFIKGNVYKLMNIVHRLMRMVYVFDVKQD